MSDLLTPDLIDALARRPLDHGNDLRPESRAEVERIRRLTDEQLANLRGQICPVPGCDERDCQSLCDFGNCKRHGDLIEVKPLVFRTVCEHHCREYECACGCGAVRPRYLLVNTDNHEGGGELFTEECSGVDPLESW